jgi:hypothetical protein
VPATASMQAHVPVVHATPAISTRVTLKAPVHTVQRETTALNYSPPPAAASL